MEAYFDNAATTKPLECVREIMIKTLTDDYGNPSSKHTKGMDAEQYISDARNIIAKTLKCEPKNIIFTSGGTEANNQALIGTAIAEKRKGKHIITTVFEHASVHEPLIFLESMGYEVTYVPVTEYGDVDKDELLSAIRPDTVLVSVMAVNNEVGSVIDIDNLACEVKAVNPGVVFHADAIQAYGKMMLYPKKWNVDLMSVSSHKIHGPKGAGFLYKSDNIKLMPYIYGGGQEKGMRSGTENVPAIAGFGCAAEKAYGNITDNISHMRKIKQILIDGILEIPDTFINANPENSAQYGAPHIVSASFAGIKSEVLLHALAAEGVYVSSGSACSSNHPGLSGTLKAIGLRDDLTDSTIRLSISKDNTKEEAEYAVNILKKHVPVLRKFRRY